MKQFVQLCETLNKNSEYDIMISISDSVMKVSVIDNGEVVFSDVMPKNNDWYFVYNVISGNPSLAILKGNEYQEKMIFGSAQINFVGGKLL